MHKHVDENTHHWHIWSGRERELPIKLVLELRPLPPFKTPCMKSARCFLSSFQCVEPPVSLQQLLHMDSYLHIVIITSIFGMQQSALDKTCIACCRLPDQL